MFIRRASIPDALTVDERLPAAWIATFLDFSSAVVEGLRDVESMDMPRDYTRDEEERIDQAVCPDACKAHYREGRHEAVYQ